MATVVVDQMRDRLLSLDEAAHRLQETEPVASTILDATSKISFEISENWKDEISAREDTDVVEGTMTVNGHEMPLTKRGLLSAASNFGITEAYAVKRIPGYLLQSLLNYHYGLGLNGAEFNMLTVDNKVSAFIRPTLRPFSNVRLFEEIVDGINRQYGEATEILVDYKFTNSLARTDVRFIIPERERVIRDGNMNDVPVDQPDLWSSGIHFSNSLMGKTQTSIEAYLFRWWCTNGCTESPGDIGTWSRKSNGSEEGELYYWAREAVDEVLGGMEDRFDQVQRMTKIDVSGGRTSDVLKEVFSSNSVPVAQRDRIQERLLGADSLTMYTVMNAISEEANNPDIDPNHADRLMRITGDIPNVIFNTERAKVWDEGHRASKSAPNPYEIVY